MVVSEELERKLLEMDDACNKALKDKDKRSQKWKNRTSKYDEKELVKQ